MPGSTYIYNGAQQMTSSTRDGITTTYTYAGTDQNQLLTEKITGGNSYGYVYGGNDGAGVPEIVAQTTSGIGTSSVMTDPITGQALNLTTVDGVTGLYLVDAIGNQVGLLTEARTTAFRVSYAPYGAQTVTSGGTSNEWKQNPYGFKNGNRTDNGVLVKFGMRWYLANAAPLTHPWIPRTPTGTATPAATPINSSDPTGKASACARAVTNTVMASAGLVAWLVGIVGGAFAAPFSGGLSLAIGAAGAVSLGTSAYGVTESVGATRDAC